jgi:transcriptional regulator with XRE-family HTH domain
MDMSQREYAKVLGISPMALSRIENGQDLELGMLTPERRQKLESDIGGDKP